MEVQGIMSPATKTSQKFKVHPLADRVAIRPMEETETMKGGLYIPDTAKEKPIQGEVIAVGRGGRRKGEAVRGPRRVTRRGRAATASRSARLCAGPPRRRASRPGRRT